MNALLGASLFKDRLRSVLSTLVLDRLVITAPPSLALHHYTTDIVASRKSECLLEDVTKVTINNIKC